MKTYNSKLVDYMSQMNGPQGGMSANPNYNILKG